MSYKAANAKASRPSSFVIPQTKIGEERKVFTIISGANTERSRKKRKMSEDQNPKKEHYIKSVKNILKGYTQRKKSSKTAGKKSSLKSNSSEPKVSINSQVIEQLSELRMEAAKVSAQLNNQLFQIKKQLCTSSLQVTDFYDRIIETVTKAKSHYKCLIEGGQASLTEQLHKYLMKTDANLDVLDSLLEVFSKEAKIGLSDLPVLNDIIQQSMLPPLHIEYSTHQKNFDLTLKDAISRQLEEMVTLSEVKVFSQTFDTLNRIAEKIMSNFEWIQNPLEKKFDYVPYTGSNDTNTRERSEELSRKNNSNPKLGHEDSSSLRTTSKGSFHQPTFSWTRDKYQSFEEVNSKLNLKIARFPTGH